MYIAEGRAFVSLDVRRSRNDHPRPEGKVFPSRPRKVDCRAVALWKRRAEEEDGEVVNVIRLLEGEDKVRLVAVVSEEGSPTHICWRFVWLVSAAQRAPVLRTHTSRPATMAPNIVLVETTTSKNAATT